MVQIYSRIRVPGKAWPRRNMMNIYGLQAQESWKNADLARFERLDNPTEFFTGLGEQVGARVLEITLALEVSSPPAEGYLDQVGRLTAIKRQAEEVAFSELVTIDYVPTGDEAREDWEGWRPSDSALAEWAWQQQDNEKLSWPEMVDLAEQWMLPPEFMEQLEASENPYHFVKEHDLVIKESIERRYRRFQETGQL